MQLQVASAWDNCIPHTIQQNSFEEENFHEFRGFVAICESFLHEIEGMTSFGGDISEQSAKVFPAKILFRESFLPQKFHTIRYVE